jgi:hypothetical protein
MKSWAVCYKLIDFVNGFAVLPLCNHLKYPASIIQNEFSAKRVFQAGFIVVETLES